MNESGTGFGDLKINPEQLAHLVDLITDGKIMSRQAKDILQFTLKSIIIEKP
jgi:Asp-tRNA(Asn)/Glu-tRNA(Gln) amidotransferase B subunit